MNSFKSSPHNVTRKEASDGTLALGFRDSSQEQYSTIGRPSSISSAYIHSLHMVPSRSSKAIYEDELKDSVAKPHDFKRNLNDILLRRMQPGPQQVVELQPKKSTKLQQHKNLKVTVPIRDRNTAAVFLLRYGNGRRNAAVANIPLHTTSAD